MTLLNLEGLYALFVLLVVIAALAVENVVQSVLIFVKWPYFIAETPDSNICVMLLSGVSAIKCAFSNRYAKPDVCMFVYLLK